MRDITIRLYKYNELPTDSAKGRALDWGREILHEDFEYVLTDAKEVLHLCGFSDVDIQFSGWGCQGDGANFIGKWNASAIQPGMLHQHAPQDTHLHRIVDALDTIAHKYPNAGVILERSDRRYSHEHTVDFGHCEGWNISGWGIDFADFIEEARGLMRWIYKQLEAEHEYQNSDEALAETLEANDYEFTESGERYR